MKRISFIAILVMIITELFAFGPGVRPGVDIDITIGGRNRISQDEKYEQEYSKLMNTIDLDDFELWLEEEGYTRKFAEAGYREKISYIEEYQDSLKTSGRGLEVGIHYDLNTTLQYGWDNMDIDIMGAGITLGDTKQKNNFFSTLSWLSGNFLFYDLGYDYFEFDWAAHFGYGFIFGNKVDSFAVSIGVGLGLMDYDFVSIPDYANDYNDYYEDYYYESSWLENAWEYIESNYYWTVVPQLGLYYKGAYVKYYGLLGFDFIQADLQTWTHQIEIGYSFFFGNEGRDTANHSKKKYDRNYNDEDFDLDWDDDSEEDDDFDQDWDDDSEEDDDFDFDWGDDQKKVRRLR